MKKNDIRGCHVKFSFSEKLYKYHLNVEVETDSDDAQVMYKKGSMLTRPYLDSLMI